MRFGLIVAAIAALLPVPANAQRLDTIYQYSLTFQVPGLGSRPQINGSGQGSNDVEGLGGGAGGCYFAGGGKCRWGYQLLPSGDTIINVTNPDYSQLLYSFRFTNLYWGIGRSVDGSGATITASSIVPEPNAWIFMVLGFGMIGASLRYGQRRQHHGHAWK